ncbi:MAG: hypothetical protein J7L73_09480 [Anaerolineales bacterium]|nr:hypothetical protein [Anaerolineales bacterium]
MENTALNTHPWLKQVHVSFVVEEVDNVLETVVHGLAKHFERFGNIVQQEPDEKTDMIITTTKFGEVVNWRKALLFTGRRRFKLSKTPTVLTIVHVLKTKFNEMLSYLDNALKTKPLNPDDFRFPGLAESAYQVLTEQGNRGGPILALLRLIQGQTKSIRVLLVVGDEKPDEAYLFDLVGAYPRIDAKDNARFYDETVLRLTTAVSTHEITNHQVEDDMIPHKIWENLSSVPAMITAAKEFGKRNFFTQMVRIADLVYIPALAETISSQYSEGCFATWDYTINALVTTVTGSARPVEKDSISEDDLAVIDGVRPDGQGAIVKHVEGKRNDPPSSEAVEMYALDRNLPRINYTKPDGSVVKVPVTRSKLHGHRGIIAFDPRKVEHVSLDAAYYSFPVSCSTEAQAKGIEGAFSRAKALLNPDDPRQVVFTILPGHGIVIVEKWVEGKVPFQVIWEYMDKGYLEVSNHVPQGKIDFIKSDDGRLLVKDLTNSAVFS